MLDFIKKLIDVLLPQEPELAFEPVSNGQDE